MGLRLPLSSGVPDSELGPEQQVEAPRIPELAEGGARAIRSRSVASQTAPRRAARWDLREVGLGHWLRTLLHRGFLLRRLSSWDWRSSQKMKRFFPPDLVFIEDSRGLAVTFRCKRLCWSCDGGPGMEGDPQSHGECGERAPKRNKAPETLSWTPPGQPSSGAVRIWA